MPEQVPAPARAGVLEWIRKKADRIHRRLFPRSWGLRSIEHERTWHDERDAKSLAAASLPEGEEIRIPYVWVIDVFLASHAAALEKQLRRLGLNKGFLGISEQDSIESIINARVGGGLISAVNLGSLSARPTRGESKDRAALPLGVDWAQFHAVSAISGATIIVGRFEFNDETARSIEEPFDTQYRATATVERAGIIRYSEGAHLRLQAAEDARAMLRRRCEHWMRKHLPGAFAEEAEPLPACELMTFTIADVFDTREPPSRGSNASKLPGPRVGVRPPVGLGSGEEGYLDILGQSSSNYAWGCVEIEGLALRLPRAWRQHHVTEDHLVLTARVDGTTPNADPAAKETPILASARWLTETLSVFAVARLLTMYETRLGKLRDRLGGISLEGRRALTEMSKLERDLAQVARDLRPLALGIAAIDDRFWRWNVHTFVPLDEDDRRAGPLFSALRNSIAERSSKLLGAEEEVRSTSRSIADLVSGSANLKVAQASLMWARVATGVAIVGAILAAATPEGRGFISGLFSGLLDWIHSLVN